MDATYEFVSPAKIIFGWGQAERVGPALKAFGRRVFVVSGSRSLAANGTADAILDSLRSHVDVQKLTTISREPTVADVDTAVAAFHKAGGTAEDCVVALGGGSALDLGKAVAGIALARPQVSAIEYLEGVGSGIPLPQATLPLIAMPTTAGTGSEVTKNAVISGDETAFKKSLRGEQLVAQLVVVDPQLTVSCPPAVTASSGMDAITQLIESYVSTRARPIPQALCIDGLRVALPAIEQAYRQPDDQAARTAMSHAALMSGLALANSGLGMAHGIAASLGSNAGLPHGLSCAAMLPLALRWNRVSHADSIADLFRAAVPELANSNTNAVVDRAIEIIVQLNTDLDIPMKLSELGVEEGQLDAITSGSTGNSMAGNPRKISQDQLRELLGANF